MFHAELPPRLGVAQIKDLLANVNVSHINIDSIHTRVNQQQQQQQQQQQECAEQSHTVMVTTGSKKRKEKIKESTTK
jgi:predicted transposase YdaD